MSGGHFNCNLYNLEDMADEVQELIDTNDKPNEYGESRNYSSHIIDEFKLAIKTIKRAKVYLHRIDYLVCCDDSEESFQRTLFKELGEIH